MANTFIDQSRHGDQLIYTWILDTDGGGDAKRIGPFIDKSYAMWGTWDGASIVLQGSWHNPHGTPDDTSFMTLTETNNTTSINNNANTIGCVLENPVWIRPLMSSAGTTSVKVVVSAPWRKRK